MALTLGDTAPDFVAQTTEGPISFHEWLGDSWAVLFSHPRNFTPVCTTELGYMASIEPEFAKRGVKIIGLSVDPVENHAQWGADIEETQGTAPNYPLIGDSDFNVAKLYGMLPADVEGDPTKRTPADNQTVRNVFVIGSDKKIKLLLVYPMTTGRNFDEVLRVIDSLQLTANHKVATPAQWQPGDDVIIAGSVSNEEAAEKYPDGWKTPKPYIRIVPQPGLESARASTTDQLLQNARAYAASFQKGDLPLPPGRKIAILACMDARLNPYGLLGLSEGDAHVIRNAGGVVTNDEIRSLAISQRLLGTEEIILIHHTDCGMLTFTDDEFKRSVQEDVGIKPKWSAEAFPDLDEDVRQSIARIKASPFIPRKNSVRGFVYDVHTGALAEVAGDVGAPHAGDGNGNGRHAYIDPKYGHDALATF